MKYRRAISIVTCGGLLLQLLFFLGSATAVESPATVGRFIAVLKEQADTSRIASITDLDKRRWALYELKTETAGRSQAGLMTFLRQEQLAGRVSEARSIWIVNAVAFTGNASVAQAVAARPEVREVSVDETITISDPVSYSNHPALWNLAQSKVRQAWAHGYSGASTGRPIVVGQIDTGVQWQHPALESKFRGRTGIQTANPNYHWLDFISGNEEPWDPNGHGTHVMGTILGGNGGTAEGDVGVAYGAKWIAARAFDQDGKGFTTDALLASEWMLAPTDMYGREPRPDLAPDIVNNSWGTDAGCRIWWKIVIESWVFNHIVPVFSIGDAGNAGPHSPGDLSGGAGVGASDLEGEDGDKVADFSARGTDPASCALDPALKPDVVAPGVAIKSSIPFGSGGPAYAFKNGTSMSAAHVSGLAALVLDAAGTSFPVTATINAIKDNADRTWDSDDTCDQHRLDLGCGRINADRTVQAVRRDGSLSGHVRGPGGVALQGAKVSVVPVQPNGETERSVYTGPDGSFSIGHLLGTYSVTVRLWGYVTLSPITGCSVEECIVKVERKETVRREFRMSAAGTTSISGVVRQYASGDGIPGVTVKILDAPLCVTTATQPCLDPVVTDGSGKFTFHQVPVTSPVDRYQLNADEGKCALAKTVEIQVPQANYDVVRPLRRDGFGYFCVETPSPWVQTTDPLTISGDDASMTVPIPFQFPFYGKKRDKAYVSTNGFIRFDARSSEFHNTPIPYGANPNAALYPLWTDLDMDADSKILTHTESNSFTIEFRDMMFFGALDLRATFQVTLHANGDVEFRYGSYEYDQARGSEATIGIEQDFGETGLQYSYKETAVRPGDAIMFSSAVAPGVLRGVVSGTGAGPFGGVEVSATLEGSTGEPIGPTRIVTTDEEGSYRFWLNVGSYTVSAAAFRYVTKVEKGVVIQRGRATELLLELDEANLYVVSGRVVDGNGNPVAAIPVALDDPRIDGTISASDGSYSISNVPAGVYELSARGSGRCRKGVPVSSLSVQADTTQQLIATTVKDSFGYSCVDHEPSAWIAGTQRLALLGDDVAIPVAFPNDFSFPFYGRSVDTVYITTNGSIEAQPGSAGNNTSIPSKEAPNLALYPFWADLELDELSEVFVSGNSSTFVVEWRDAKVSDGSGGRVTFETILHSDGKIEFQYKDLSSDDLSKGSRATIGIEDATGTIAFQYSYRESALSDGLRIGFLPSSKGLIGAVKDASTRQPIAGAKVTLTGGVNERVTFTGADGGYGFDVVGGTYQVKAARFGYFTSDSTSVVVPDTGSISHLISLTPAPAKKVQGVVKDLQNRTVGNLGIDISHPDSSHFVGTVLTKEKTGTYIVDLPRGTYDLQYTGRGLCMASRTRPASRRITVTDPMTVDFVFDMLRDGYGYTCRERTTIASRGLASIGPVPQGRFLPVPLPFGFNAYGEKVNVACVAPNGWIQLDRDLGSLSGEMCGVPDLGLSAGAKINVFKTEAVMDDRSQVVVGNLPSCFDCSPNPDDPPIGFIIEWRNVLLSNGERVSFSVTLRADGALEMQYFNGSTFASTGRNATIGIESSCGASSLTYFEPGMDTSASNLGPVFPGAAIGFMPPGIPGTGC